ncbi:hypothetical protein FS749_015999 [Ceratobasidium sp. UAMH 11750]|nr:hypothetical protein FS749_015999 [Ceratobasidium sp. UAMH 11750]
MSQIWAFAGVSLIALLAHAAPASSHITRQDPTYNDGIHLAIGPTCGLPSTNGSVADVNAGLGQLGTFKTIVSFGDSFTSDGKFDGSAPDPPVQMGTSPRVPGAVTDTAIWPSKATESSFVQQASIFMSKWSKTRHTALNSNENFSDQSHSFDPDTTLYSVFFGINDYSASAKDGDHMLEAADALLSQVRFLSEAPTNAKYFLVIDGYGRGITHRL